MKILLAFSILSAFVVAVPVYVNVPIVSQNRTIANTFTYTPLASDFSGYVNLYFALTVIVPSGAVSWTVTPSSAALFDFSTSATGYSGPKSGTGLAGDIVVWIGPMVYAETDNYGNNVFSTNTPITFTVGGGSNDLLFSVVLKSSGLLFSDAAGEIGTDGVIGTTKAGTVPSAVAASSTSQAFQATALMLFHEHRALQAYVTNNPVTDTNLLKTYMRNLVIPSIDDLSYFGGYAATTVRTCVTNYSCAVEARRYYVEVLNKNLAPLSGFTLAFTLVNAAPAATVSVVALVLACAFHFITARAVRA